MARTARRRDAARTREALVSAGSALFAERGYEGVPVSLIAEKAGVNKAMINYHFRGKRGLYLAIVGAAFGEIVARVEALADSSRPAPDVLRDLVTVVGDVATRRSPHFCAMMLREVLAGGQRLDEAVLDQPVRVLLAVQRIVERGVRERTLRVVDPVLTHLTIVGSLVFFFASGGVRQRILAGAGRHGIRPPSPAAYIEHLQELLARGLATTGARDAAEPSHAATASRRAGLGRRS